jgi:outer membrane protein, heavy metal efflux system
MFSPSPAGARAALYRWLWAGALLALGWAQPLQAAPADLASAFANSWPQQPEARALAQRREAGQAHTRAAGAWTPAPPTVELALRTDQFNQRLGARELSYGLSVPLWLPGERPGQQRSAAALTQLTEGQARHAQWLWAGRLREAWWQAAREAEQARAAAERLDQQQRLSADVARRWQAGDVSRADQHQAEAALAAARADHAQAQALAQGSAAALRALVGAADAPALKAEPEPATEPDPLLQHPELQWLAAQAQALRAAAELARVQSRDSPELTLQQSRERGARIEPSVSTLTLGVRIPFGGGDRHRASTAQAAAALTEAEAQLSLATERVRADVQARQALLAAAREGLTQATLRERLTRDTRGFVDKAFQLGEADWPTRLRAEQDAATAARDLARARIDALHALSTYRQALGLLPE